MLNKTCDEFVDVLASKEPVPGGGGASAYVGALGVALGEMVANLTIGKKKYASVQEDVENLIKRAEILIKALKKLVNEDARAFEPLAKAYRLPSESEAEKAAKDAAIQAALVGATATPLEIVKKCVEAMEIHEELAIKGSRLVLSDVGCGAAFCRAALQGARISVLINLKSLKNPDLKASFQKELDELTDKGLKLADDIYRYVEENV